MTENRAIAPLPGEAIRYPAIFETRPDKITWHFIEDHELDALANVSRPIVLGLATTFLGSALGLAPAAFIAWDKLDGAARLSSSDALNLVFAAVSVALAVVFGCFAAKGQMDAMRIKALIRNRRPTQVATGQWQPGEAS